MTWILWALNLLAQNFSFTFVSRARNGKSLWRHVVAAIASNGIFILQFQIMLGPMYEYMSGKHGLLAQLLTGAYYTVFTVTGSVLAHKWSMRNEKGKAAVVTMDQLKLVEEAIKELQTEVKRWTRTRRSMVLDVPAEVVNG